MVDIIDRPIFCLLIASLAYNWENRGANMKLLLLNIYFDIKGCVVPNLSYEEIL